MSDMAERLLEGGPYVTNKAPTRDLRILRKAQVLEMTGLSYSTVWRLEKAGQFPARRQLGAKSVGWIAKEVENWILTRAKAGRG